ncbi:helix-turn-helix domain-containing protein [Amycolatopsis sacchari]|uniref:helix-turn-helix domain-containing protein n=1 Tax=Amycolatopsis TaxID=1813 RepID=UPI003D72C7AA
MDEEWPSGRGGFQPIVARTRTAHHPVGPVAYDCVKVIVVRDGSAFLFSEFDQQPVKTGDVILLGANTLCGSEPEGHITVTTIYADTDYVLDQVFWQYVGLLHDRLEAQDFAATVYTEPAQILHLGEDRAGTLVPWLDELVALSIDGRFVESFYRMQALWFSITHIIAPFIKTSTVRTSPTQRARAWPTQPRHRRFAPLRAEVRKAAELLRADPARCWSVDELAEAVHLSRSQVFRVFTEAYGKTPIAYLTMLRTERMAGLLRSTDAPIALIAREVGWGDADFASRQFRRSVGITPGKYRTMNRAGTTGTTG